MHTTTAVIASAWLATAAIASPIEVPRLGFAYSVPITKSPLAKYVYPLSAMTAPYGKYDAPLTPVLAAAKAKQSKKAALITGSTTTTPMPVDVQYLVPVQIQSKTFDMILDTGSSDLWVFSDQLPAADKQNGRTIYNTAKGTIKTGQTFSVSYGDGSYASGKVYSDKVSIGGVTVLSQAVEAATEVSSSFASSSNGDGLLGMAFSSLNAVRPTQQTTFFGNAASSLVSPIFAVNFKHQATGSLDFGFINATKYLGPLSYVAVSPAANPYYWSFSIKRYGINGSDYAAPNGPFTAIVDTGTSLTYLPDAIVKDYYRRIPGSGIDAGFGMWAFPCAATIPPMGVWIAGVKYPMRADVLNWERINATHCLGGVQQSGNLPFSILGATWLKTVYAVFDAGSDGQGARMGFAKQNPNA